jgi:ribonuclease P protein component
VTGTRRSTPPLPGAGRADRTRRQREAHLSAEQPQAGQAPRLSSPDADASRPRRAPGPSSQGSRSPLGVIWRIRDRATFARFRRDGRRFRIGPVWMTVIPAPTAVPPRVAYAVGRSAGNAVDRNRVRRRLRALVHAHAAELVPGWYLVGADGSFGGSPFVEAEAQFARLVKEASSVAGAGSARRSSGPAVRRPRIVELGRHGA